MKPKNNNQAFTAVELLVVVGVLALLAGMLLPTIHRNPDRRHYMCRNNLKQVGIGFRLYATDGEPYPQYDATNEVWQYFQKVGREIGSPKVLICPMDTARTDLKNHPLDFEQPPTSNSFAHGQFRDSTLSYFYNVDSSEQDPGSIVAGDRNISTNTAMISGLLTVQTNTPVQWTDDIHKSRGNILLADGSVQRMPSIHLREQVRLATNETQRYLIPR